MKNEKKLNNKGFSLVELIIVIAIMAVLIAVLAPQYMKYVERGRNSTDRDNATAMESAMMVWGSETVIPSGETAFTTGTGTITVTQSAMTIGGGQAAAITSALKNAGLSTTDTRCQSRTAFNQYVITVTISADGTVSVATVESTATP